MIEVFKLKVIEDEKEREAVLEIIEEREKYYKNLFANDTRPPRIRVTFEGNKPLNVRILFSPPKGRTVVVNESSYSAPAAATKHAFKKLRRVAKNYFTKTKKRYRN